MFSMANGFLFGKPAEGPKPDELKEQMSVWKKGINKEIREMNKQVRDIESKIITKRKADILRLMKKTGHENEIRQLAKQIAEAKQTIERVQVMQQQLNSVLMTLQEQAAMIKVTGVLSKAAGMMHTMSSLLNGAEVSADLRHLAEEMQKAGILGEMVDEAVDESMPGVAEGDVDDVVEGILFEVTAGAIGKPLPTGMPTQVGVGSAVVAPAAAGRVAVASGGPTDGGVGSSGFEDRFSNV